MKQKIIIIASLLGLLSACTQLATPAPTPLPPNYLPTVVALTGQAMFATADALTSTAMPANTPLPAETAIPTETPIPLPTATPTFEPGFTDLAQVHFISPGPMSSLTSPINLQVLLVSGQSGIVQVDLLGEDGRVLQRDIERVARSLSGNYRNIKLDFEIRAVSEKGYIRISSKDNNGRIQVLNTMPVLLYSVGDNIINPVGNMIYERTMLEGLKEGSEIYGGVLNLKGRFWPFNTQPVFVELLLPDGKPGSSRVLAFKGTDPEEFETTLPYKITEPTLALLTFRQDNPELSVSDPDLKKYIYVYTMEVMLNP